MTSANIETFTFYDLETYNEKFIKEVVEPGFAKIKATEEIPR